MITYGNGEVLFDGNSKVFEITYKGVIRITDSPDNLYISANENKIIGFMIDNSNLPKKLFNYAGEFKVKSFKENQDGKFTFARALAQGFDYWQIDYEKWENDESLWGTRDKTYTFGAKQKFDKRRIVVNKNIVVDSDKVFVYEDGSPVPAGELIHIDGLGNAMTGGVPSKDSMKINRVNKRSAQQLKRIVNKLRQSATASSGGSGGSTGGGY
tara:strand:+ start:3751 stop:4386 length:636 start_codon:yes stop_codon:yes gene_type:complete